MLLSIAIAVYNGEKYLPQMLNSILEQNFCDYELLLLDDGSTDNSGSICDKYAREDSRIRVLHKKNEGLCATRNLAINMALGKYICFLDQDDKLLPGALESYHKAINEQEADFYVAGYLVRVENSREELIELRTVYTPDKYLDAPKQIRQFYVSHINDGTVAPIWNIVYSLAFLKAKKLSFDENLRMSLDDLEFHSRAFFVAERVKILSCICNEYYVRSIASSSRKYNKDFLDQAEEVLSRLESQIISAGLYSGNNKNDFNRYVFNLYVISGLQNIIYARKYFGKKRAFQEIVELITQPLTQKVLGQVKEISKLSKYEKIIFKFADLQRIRMLYYVISAKDTVRKSRFLPFFKKISVSRKK